MHLWMGLLGPGHAHQCSAVLKRQLLIRGRKGHALMTLAAHVMPAGCPPATMWSSFPGQVALLLLRLATQSSMPLGVSTYPLMCTPAQAPRSTALSDMRSCMTA